MVSLSILSFLSLTSVAQIYAQILNVGKCPSFPEIEDFSVDRYAGKWYEFEKSFNLLQRGSKCFTATYTPAGQHRFTLSNTQIQMRSGQRRTFDGVAQSLTPGASGKFGIKFNKFPYSLFPSSPYEVLETDYTNYTIVLQCTKASESANLQTLWLLVRSPTPTPDVLRKARKSIQRLGFKTFTLRQTDQETCQN